MDNIYLDDVHRIVVCDRGAMTDELVEDGDLWDVVDLFDDIDPAIPDPKTISCEMVAWLCNSVVIDGKRYPWPLKRKTVISLQMELI